MRGKILSTSDNIYQDQAKILFDYYRQQAEKIVREEERIENEISNLETLRAQLEENMGKLWVWFLTIILFFVYFIKKNKLEAEIAEINTRIDEFKKMHAEIFRDYKVTKMGVAYVPVANQVKYNDKSFIVDYTGTVPNSEVALQVSRQNDLLIDTINKLEAQANEAPIVETSKDAETIQTDSYSTSIQEINQHDYLGGLERSLRTVSFCMNDLDTTSVALPLVANHSPQLNYLRQFATRNIPNGATVINVFDSDRYSDSIEKFQELNKLKDSLSSETQQFEEVLKDLMSTVAQSVQAISALKLTSVDKVVTESNKMLVNILKAPYNHYSPMLEFEEIERIKNETFDYSEDVQSYEPFRLKQSSRMRFNLFTGMWTSEDGNVTNMPFGVHQIHEEIVAPVVQNLMNETRIERLKIYNNIKDQKLSYLNKWHQDTDAFYRANRAESSDIINIMQESLREYVAAYNTLISLKKTEDSMQSSNGDLSATVVDTVDNTTETLTAYELQSQEFQKTQLEFEEYMERLKEDIDMKAQRFGHVEYYDAKLRDGYSNEMAVASSEIHKLDERRKGLASVNPLFAKTSTIPPAPNVEDITFEHMALNLPIMAKEALNNLSTNEPSEPVIVDNGGFAAEEWTTEEVNEEPASDETMVPTADEDTVALNIEDSNGDENEDEVEINIDEDEDEVEISIDDDEDFDEDDEDEEDIDEDEDEDEDDDDDEDDEDEDDDDIDDEDDEDDEDEDDEDEDDEDEDDEDDEDEDDDDDDDNPLQSFVNNILNN